MHLFYTLASAAEPSLRASTLMPVPFYSLDNFSAGITNDLAASGALSKRCTTILGNCLYSKTAGCDFFAA